MLEKIVKLYSRAITKLFAPVAILIVVATWFAFPHVVSLFKNIQTDFKVLLPEDYASVKRLDTVSELFGNLKNMVLVLETKDPESAKTMIPKFAEFLADDPRVDYVDWRKPGYDFFDLHKLFYLSTEDLEELHGRIDRRIQREKLGGLYIDFGDDDESQKDTFDDLKDKYANKFTGKVTSEFFTNEDESVFLVAIQPKGKNLNIAYFKRFGAHIKERVAKFNPSQYDPSLKIHYTGGVITSVHEYDSLIRDLRIAGIISGSLIMLLILLYFRSLRALVFVSLPLGCGMIWNFAIAYLTIGHLNMITAFLFSILFGLGIDFGIHLNSRYNEERANGACFYDAIVTMLYQTGRSSFTAGTTTAAAFIVLVINDFKGFSEFGWIAGIGIMITLFAYIVVLPVMLSLEEKIRFIRRKRFAMTGWHLEHICRIKPRLMIAGLISGVSLSIVLSIAFMRFDYDFTNFRAPNKALDLAQELEHTVNPQRAVPSVVLVHSREDAEAAKAAIEKIMDNNPNTLIDSTKHIYNIVPSNQDEKIPTMRKIKILLEDEVVEKLVKGEDKGKIDRLRASTVANTFTMDDIPGKIKEAFLHKETGEKNQLVYIFLDSDVDLKNGKLAMALAKDIRDIKTENGKTYHATSSSIIFADVLTVMLRDSKKAIALSFLAVFLLLLIDFKSFKFSVITMIPLLSGIFIMLGIMVVIRMNLNFFNMIVLPVILGIGIDNGVHFFHRFQEEGYGNVEKVLTTTGGAIVMTTLTTAAGFAGMCFAHHRGLSSIGIAADIGMMACLGTTLFFFPAILRRIWPRQNQPPVDC